MSPPTTLTAPLSRTWPWNALAPTSSPPGLAPMAAGGRGRACRCPRTSGHLAAVKGSTARGRTDQRQRKVQDPNQGPGDAGSALVTPLTAAADGALRPEQLCQHQHRLHARERGQRHHGSCPARGCKGLSHTGLGSRCGVIGGFSGSSPQPGPDPSGNGTRQTQGSVHRRGAGARRRGGDAPLRHPQRDMQALTRMESTLFCTDLLRGTEREGVSTERDDDAAPRAPLNPPGSAAAAARGQHHPRALPGPAHAPRCEQRRQDEDAERRRLRTHGLVQPLLPVLRVSLCTHSPAPEQSRRKNHSPRGRSRQICATAEL